MIKNEMKIAMQAEVQAHKDAVTAGTKTQPDLTGVEEAYLLQYQTKIQEFTDANTARKDAAKDKVQQGESDPFVRLSLLKYSEEMHLSELRT